jgi:hypothetical protein
MDDSEFGVTFYRHGEKGKDKKLTEVGHELSIQTGRSELADQIEKLPEGAVVLMLPVSDAVRTRETMADLKTGLESAHLPDLTIIDVPAEIDRQKFKSLKDIQDWINQQIENHPKGKTVIHIPLGMSDLSTTKNINLSLDPAVSPYAEYNYSLKEDEVLVWLSQYIKSKAGGPESGEKYSGPSADLIADDFFSGLDRLTHFIKKHSSDENSLRPVSVVMVGHSWMIDAALAKALNGGVLNAAALEKLKGTMINPDENAGFTINNNQITTQYRGQEVRSPIFWREQ